jgi:hypothetical protein
MCPMPSHQIPDKYIHSFLKSHQWIHFTPITCWGLRCTAAPCDSASHETMFSLYALAHCLHQKCLVESRTRRLQHFPLSHEMWVTPKRQPLFVRVLTKLTVPSLITCNFIKITLTNSWKSWKKARRQRQDWVRKGTSLMKKFREAANLFCDTVEVKKRQRLLSLCTIQLELNRSHSYSISKIELSYEDSMNSFKAQKRNSEITTGTTKLAQWDIILFCRRSRIGAFISQLRSHPSIRRPLQQENEVLFGYGLCA